MLEVNPVNDRRRLRQFIRLPWSIYSNDPVWVPPLLLERKEHLSPVIPISITPGFIPGLPIATEMRSVASVPKSISCTLIYIMKMRAFSE